MLVGLPEEEAAARGGLEEFGCQEAAETEGGKRERGKISRRFVLGSGAVVGRGFLTYLIIVDWPAEVW